MRLAVKAAAWVTVQERVLGNRGGLPIGRAGHDEPVHALEGPGGTPVAHAPGSPGRWAREFDCQPVEQFRVGWSVAGDAEVTRRGDDSRAEMLLPQAIHHHPGRQRILGIGDPFGERGTAAAGGAHRLDVGVAVVERGEVAGLEFVAGAAPRAAFEQVRRWAVWPDVGHGEGRRRIGRPFLLQFGQFLGHAFPLRSHGGRHLRGRHLGPAIHLPTHEHRQLLLQRRAIALGNVQ